MKLYSSFLIRCWLIHDLTQDERSVIDVEHIQTGDHMRVSRMTEAESWMYEACRTMQSPLSNPSGAGESPVQDKGRSK